MGKKQNGKRHSALKSSDNNDNGKQGTLQLGSTTTTSNSKKNTDNKQASKSTAISDLLPPEERKYLEKCSLVYNDASSLGGVGGIASNNNKNKNKKNGQKHGKYDDSAFVHRAVEILEQEHMLVIHNALSEEELEILESCYEDLHQQQMGQRAIGERDPSKRSGTRLYNCLCQLGPACGFYDWKDSTAQARKCLNPLAKSQTDCNDNQHDDDADDSFDDAQCYFDYHGNQHKPSKKPIWKSITDKFHFTHIARVEVVTSHVGCRDQAWHVDGVHGLTVIFPLTDVGLRQGPTELDFSHPFLGLWEGDGKVRTPQVNTTVRAVMPKGSVLMFNANASHRGSANIGSRDRPILVLDCSLESTCLAAGGPRDIWSVGC